MLKPEQIYQKVSTALIEALNVHAEDVKPAATLQGDLGADSIDFLDITFRLEREFAIIIPRGELFPEAIFHGDPEFVDNGMVTGRGLQELHECMPFADLSEFEKDPQAQRLPGLFTVDLINRYIVGKLQEAGEREQTAVWSQEAVPTGPWQRRARSLRGVISERSLVNSRACPDPRTVTLRDDGSMMRGRREAPRLSA
jgi:acyl carrier protein